MHIQGNNIIFASGGMDSSALLFLAKDTDIELEQEEFYSDLYVVKGNGTRTVEV